MDSSVASAVIPVLAAMATRDPNERPMVDAGSNSLLGFSLTIKIRQSLGVHLVHEVFQGRM
jgi:hypothetical protein